MIIVPESVKEHVKQIIAEYEKEDTKYCLERIKKFKELLEIQEGPLFEGTEEDVMVRIYAIIKECYIPLSLRALYTVKRSVFAEKQLIKALERASQKANMKVEAERTLKLINDAKYSSWGQIDEYIERKYFKLVKTEEEFEKIIAGGPVWDRMELTPGHILPYQKIRIAYVEESTFEQLRKKRIIKRYNKMFNQYRGDNFVLSLEAFRFWHDIMNTAIYYVYIPKE